MEEKDIKRLLDALKAAGQSTSVFEQRLRAAEAAGKSTSEILKEMDKTLAEATANARGLNTAFSDIRQNLAANLAEIAKTNSAISQGKKAYKGVVSIASQLSDEEAGITAYNEKQLKQLNQKAQIRLISKYLQIVKILHLTLSSNYAVVNNIRPENTSKASIRPF